MRKKVPMYVLLRNVSGSGAKLMSSILLLYTMVLSSPHNAELVREYRRLEQRLHNGRALAKTTASQLGSAGVLDRHSLIWESDRTPVDVVLRRTKALFDDLKPQLSTATRRYFQNEIARLEQKNTAGSFSATSREPAESEEYAAFAEITGLRKQLAHTNQLLDFDSLLFVSRRNWYGNHMCDQYFGYFQQEGGSIYLATGLRDGSPHIIDILENSTVQNGRYQGEQLSGRGSFLSPDLSYDGDTVLFAWTEKKGWRTPEGTFHIFKVHIDGSGLTQLTDGSWNEFDPCWLPNGRVVFISERRGGYGRCHGREVPTYTLHSMKSDGSDIVCISFHETNEWHPSVDNEGKIVYTRWDYVDRDSDIAHHIWTCTPDGRDPRAPHGNYPHPLTTIPDVPWYDHTGQWSNDRNSSNDGRELRPWMEMNIRAIPNSHKYIATAAPHHDYAYGSFVMIDTRIRDDNIMSQLERVTPEEPFPESETPYRPGPYATAWPLSEDYYLCNYEMDICLLDRFGNREVLIRETDVAGDDSMRLLDPIPVRPRTPPPALATKTWQGERSGLPGHKRAVISITNVYESDMPWPDSVELKWLRIVQIFPKTTPNEDNPQIGIANQGIARMSLGVVPIEEDGSVYCEAPVGKAIYFQVLDEDRAAVHSMRSDTYVHPGENLSCYGCHEDKWKSMPPPSSTPMAFQREPSPLQPDYGGVEPINYHRLVEPIITGTCVPCHTDSGGGPTFTDYIQWSWKGFFFDAGGNGHITTERIGGSRTMPGYFGARYSEMGKAILNDAHQGRLTDDQIGKCVVWLDNMSNRLGAYHEEDRQKDGELVWPQLDVDPDNPTGVEHDRPLPDADVGLRGNRYAGQLRQGSRIRVTQAAGGAIVIRNMPKGRYVVAVHDLLGRAVVHRTVTTHGDGGVSFPGRSFARGTYLVEIRQKNSAHHSVHKLVLAR